MKFESLKPGMVVYDIRKHRMGNTTINTLSLYEVRVLEVDHEKGKVTYSWNGNRSVVSSRYACEPWKKNKPLIIRSAMGYCRLATKEEKAAAKTAEGNVKGMKPPQDAQG